MFEFLQIYLQRRAKTFYIKLKYLIILSMLLRLRMLVEGSTCVEMFAEGNGVCSLAAETVVDSPFPHQLCDNELLFRSALH